MPFTKMGDYSPESRFLRQLDEDVLEFIHGDPQRQDEHRFNQLALREFERQYHTNKPYREYCKKGNVSPATITHWEEIPAISSFAFEKLLLASFPTEKAKQICLATKIVDLKDRWKKMYWHKWDIELISTANGLLAKLFLFPDVERMKILLMVPSPKMAPWMEMAIGLENVRLKFGTPDSQFLISPLGLDIKTLVSALRQAEKAQQPLALIGVTGSFIHLFDACEKEGIRFRLPAGSRVCDVGRDKRQFGESSKDEYVRKCREIMGIEEDFCINVLWTCENSTNHFDNVLKNHFSGIKRDRCKEIPPWTRTTVVDTREFKRLPKGQTGLLRHYDLTNRVMALAVQTANLGFETEDGFEIIGRWNKRIGEIGVDHSVGHPGGKVVTQILTYLMRRRISKIGKVYPNVAKAEGAADARRQG